MIQNRIFFSESTELADEQDFMDSFAGGQGDEMSRQHLHTTQQRRVRDQIMRRNRQWLLRSKIR